MRLLWAEFSRRALCVTRLRGDSQRRCFPIQGDEQPSDQDSHANCGRRLPVRVLLTIKKGDSNNGHCTAEKRTSRREKHKVQKLAEKPIPATEKRAENVIEIEMFKGKMGKKRPSEPQFIEVTYLENLSDQQTEDPEPPRVRPQGSKKPVPSESYTIEVLELPPQRCKNRPVKPQMTEILVVRADEAPPEARKQPRVRPRS